MFKTALNLTLACFISGLIIAGVYFVTNPIAVKNEKLLKEESMKSLIGNADSFTKINDEKEYYIAKKKDETIGYIIEEENNGYGGPIKLLVAIDKDLEVMDYQVISNNETPGLGSKAFEKLFESQFKGKDLNHLVVVKDPSDKEDIVAISGATISSKAVTNIVKEAVEDIKSSNGGK